MLNNEYRKIKEQESSYEYKTENVATKRYQAGMMYVSTYDLIGQALHDCSEPCISRYWDP